MYVAKASQILWIFLTVCGILVGAEVFLGLTNVALGKAATQSSTDADGVASRAVDGNSNSDWGSDSCTHTRTTYRPWWQVDLGGLYYVHSVAIQNRDMLGDRLRDIEVYVNRDSSETLCYYYGDISTDNAYLEMICGSQQIGRYVKIQTTGQYDQDTLTLCEVEVFGSEYLQRTSARFELQPDYLTGSTLTTVTARNTLECANMCLQTIGCEAFIRTNSGDTVTCYLLGTPVSPALSVLVIDDTKSYKIIT